MKLSKKSEYGLRALMDMAARDGQSPVPLRDLADRNNIPIKFLEQIFLALRNAGIVRSQAGARGGYMLSRPAEEITLGEVQPIYCPQCGQVAPSDAKFCSRCGAKFTTS